MDDRPGPPARLARGLTPAVVLALVAVLVACSTARPRVASAPTTATTTTTAAASTAPTCTANAAEDVRSLAQPTAGDAASLADRARAELINPARLTVGDSADTLLMGFRNPQTGKLEGLDIDLLKEVARDLLGDPNAIDYKVITYAQRLPVLQNHQVDLVAHTMTINCDRWQKINFSTQYLAAGQRVLVRTDSAAQRLEDLTGQRVCTTRGGTAEANLRDNYKQIQSVVFDDLTDCMVAFQQGTADAIVSDDIVLAGFVAQDPYAKVVGPQLTQEPYGIGVAADHDALTQFVNRVLERIRGDGTWARLWSEHLGAALKIPTPTPPVPLYGRPST
jgi:polar amino acid transport system substrate-binding protein